MTTSTDGQLHFGYVFEEGFVFPWSSEQYGNDIGKWWKAINGFSHTVECPYTENGDFKPGITSNSPQIAEYYGEETEWLENNPIPVEVINYCSDSFPMYILSTGGFIVDRGHPRKIQPEDLMYTDYDLQVLDSFMKTYNITPQGDCGWYMSSFWGS
jgi:hypothetical protein